MAAGLVQQVWLNVKHRRMAREMNYFQWRLWTIGALISTALVILMASRGLSFGPTKDEAHFWPASSVFRAAAAHAQSPARFGRTDAAAALHCVRLAGESHRSGHSGRPRAEPADRVGLVGLDQRSAPRPRCIHATAGRRRSLGIPVFFLLRGPLVRRYVGISACDCRSAPAPPTSLRLGFSGVHSCGGLSAADGGISGRHSGLGTPLAPTPYERAQRC